jgi:PAS domain S-box-containing protein
MLRARTNAVQTWEFGMSDTSTATNDKTGSDNALLKAGFGVLAVLTIGLWLIFRFASSQAEQDMENWQTRLNLIADSRAADVSAWLNRHLLSVEQLAADASIQLYASHAAVSDDPTASEAQRGYIFNLLSAEAERSGFHEQRAIDTVAANVKRPQRAGLAVVTNEGKAIVMSTGMPNLRPEEWALSSGNSFIALGPTLGDKTPLILFGARISPATDFGGEESPETWIIGARPLDGDFHEALIQPGDSSQTAETYIVIPGEDGISTPITPLAEGGRIGVARTDPAATFASHHPNGFGIHANYAGTEVLVAGKELSAPVPWILVRTISSAEAMEAIAERRNSLIMTLSLAALFIIAALVLAWRHGVSRRLAISYNEKAALSKEMESLYRFVQSVCDGQRNAIAAVDEDMTVRFTNTEMATVTGISCVDLMNRRLDTAFSSDLAELLRANVERAASGDTSMDIVRHGETGEEVTFQLEVLPLNAGGNNTAKALLVMQDITDLVTTRERSETLFKQLVSTLTQIIDARDPWSKHHSARVADVAAAVASEVGMDEDGCESITIAGQLVNLGKIFVPIEILTKQTPLTPDEFSLVRDSMKKGAELVSGLDFKGPVAATLGQMHEHWDGSGEPQGLSGEDIETGARILSVANAFVGMVSARAHREGLGFDKAADILQEDAGTKYERRIIAALQSVVENKGGRERWQHYMEKPSE